MVSRFKPWCTTWAGQRRSLITSVLFGLAHLSNPSASAFSTINTILAGAWLGLAYLMTRSLWLATALHYSWNFAMVFIFGLPVSGLTTSQSTGMATRQTSGSRSGFGWQVMDPKAGVAATSP